jgi:HAD superfamily hydrolase (TIGR01549 family)
MVRPWRKRELRRASDLRVRRRPNVTGARSLANLVIGEVIAPVLAAPRPKGEVFRVLIERLGLPVSAEDVWRDYRSQMPSLVSVADGDRQALIDLRSAGWTLGILTNGTVDNQEGKIRRTGLDLLVDGWVVSEAVGVRKPLPAIFDALAANLGCDLEGWMVGDSLDDDIAGGAAVGLRTVWIAPDGSDPGHHHPLVTAHCFEAAARAILSGQDEQAASRKTPRNLPEDAGS